MTKYKVVVVDDDAGVRDFIVEFLYLRDFDAHGYAQAEKLLAEVFDAGLSPQSFPDLVMVDLQLQQNRMQGMELIRNLTDRDVPSEILVISGAAPSAEQGEAIKMGASKAIPKPFTDIFNLAKTVKGLAEIGRKRRLYRLADGEQRHDQDMDASRLDRPVFLSYSSKDKTLATGLRRNLEANGIAAWYAPDAINIGDVWRNCIKKGIDQASVFVALITDNYLASGACMGEFDRFRDRTEPGPKPDLLVLPVFAGLSDDQEKTRDRCRWIFEHYQHADISKSFTDGLTVLLGRIQTFLGQGDTTSKTTASSHPAASVPSRPERIA